MVLRRNHIKLRTPILSSNSILIISNASVFSLMGLPHDSRFPSAISICIFPVPLAKTYSHSPEGGVFVPIGMSGTLMYLDPPLFIPYIDQSLRIADQSINQPIIHFP